MSELRVRVTPRSSRNKVTVEGEEVKIWVMAAPTDGQANEAVGRLLAKTLGVAPSKVSLVRGETSRDKVFDIDGFSIEDVLIRLR